MNFLAHAYLSDNKPDIIVGNFIADFLRGRKAVEELPEAIQQGIFIHRKIDAFTDKHLVVDKSIEHIKPTQGRYASVIMDVFYDYFLIKNWSKFSDIGLSDFTQNIYEVLLEHILLYPDFLQKRLPMMVADDWMVRYGEIDGLKFTFSKMAQRITFPNQFHTATEDLLQFEKELNEEFLVFFPELVAFVNTEIQEISS